MKGLPVRWAAAVFALALASAADATTRYWYLQNVAFDDGTTVSGSFAYDDATHAVGSWSVRVKGGVGFLPFTYLPGNSVAYTDVGDFSALPTIILSSADGAGGAMAERQFRITPTTALDGSPTSVPVDTATALNRGGGIECFDCSPYRFIVSGSINLSLLPPPIAIVPVIEFYHAGFNHYFMTADTVEINALDTHYFTGWERTGYQFFAYPTGASAGGTINPVCRYYGLPSAGLDSHFYSASALECFQVNQFYGAEWQIESDNVFQINLPNTTTGACPSGTIPIYRVFNNRHDANHRYMTSTVVRAQMEAAGWIREGYGPNATIMCAIEH